MNECHLKRGANDATSHMIRQALLFSAYDGLQLISQ